MRPTRFRWVVFALAFSTSWMLYLHRYVFALIKPMLAAPQAEGGWGLSKTDLGVMDSIFGMCYTGFQIPLGVLSDLAGAHLMLTLMVVVWSLGLAMHAWAPSKEYLGWARGLLGLGQAAVFASLSRVTRTWFPYSTRSTVQGLVGVFAGRFGGLSANLLFAAVMIGVWGIPWRMAVYIFAAFGAVLAILFATLFRDSPARHPWVNEEEAKLIGEGFVASDKPRQPIRELFGEMRPRSIANLGALNLQSILSTIADNIYSAWIPLFLFEVHGLKFKEMGIYSALPLAGGALGGALGGWLNDQLIQLTGNARWSRTGVAFLGKGLAAAILLGGVLFAYDQPRTFCLLLFFVKFFGDWSLSTSWATITDIAGPASASVFAFNNSVAGIGALLAPIMYGYVADQGDWKTVFLIAIGMYVACAASWLMINCRIPLLPEKGAK